MVSCNLSKPLELDCVLNIIGLVFTKLFISITVLTMELFFVDVMPNGRMMIKAYPQVELGGDKWQAVVPVAIVACHAWSMAII